MAVDTHVSEMLNSTSSSQVWLTAGAAKITAEQTMQAAIRRRRMVSPDDDPRSSPSLNLPSSRPRITATP
jgi:hypothetical protein